MRSFDASTTERSRARREIRDARLPLILRHCCTCDLVIEVRHGKMDRHSQTQLFGFGTIGTTMPCPGKRWRRAR